MSRRSPHPIAAGNHAALYAPLMSVLRALFVLDVLLTLAACGHQSPAPEAGTAAEREHNAMCTTAAEVAHKAQMLPTSYLKQHCEKSEPDTALSVESICLAYQYRLKLLRCTPAR
jgi:predicted small lipoprotein YifL